MNVIFSLLPRIIAVLSLVAIILMLIIYFVKKQNKKTLKIAILIVLAIFLIVSVIVGFDIHKKKVGFVNDKVSFNMTPFEVMMLNGSPDEKYSLEEEESYYLCYKTEYENHEMYSMYKFFDSVLLSTIYYEIDFDDENEANELVEKLYNECKQRYEKIGECSCNDSRKRKSVIVHFVGTGGYLSTTFEYSDGSVNISVEYNP